VKVLLMTNLRHTFASQQLIQGTPPLKVAKMMGHKHSGVTLRVYARWAEKEESHGEELP
jgi:integrase